MALDLPEDDAIVQAAGDQHAEQPAGDEEPPTQTRAKRQHSRKPLPDHLDRKDEILSPGDACHDCGGSLRQVSEDVTEVLGYTRATSRRAGSYVRVWPAPIVKPLHRPRCRPA